MAVGSSVIVRLRFGEGFLSAASFGLMSADSLMVAAAARVERAQVTDSFGASVGDGMVLELFTAVVFGRTSQKYLVLFLKIPFSSLI